jgi:hypothetical protein
VADPDLTIVLPFPGYWRLDGHTARTFNRLAEFISMPSFNGFIVSKSQPIRNLSLGEPQHGNHGLTSGQDPR